MKGDFKMNCIKCASRYMDINRKMIKAVFFGAVTAGVAAGAYVSMKKIYEVVEDRKLARYYEDEI